MIFAKIKFHKLISVIFFYFILIENAHAYFDPGTGSFIIQAILGMLAAGFTTAIITWTKFKNFLSKLFKKKIDKKNQKK